MSKAATSVLQAAVKTGQELVQQEHKLHCRAVLQTAHCEAEMIASEQLASLLSDMPAMQKRTLSWIIEGESSGWLTVLLLVSEGYDLLATQFRDQLAMRYHREPVSLPSICDGCGASFSLQHGLDCKKDELVKQGHDGL